MRYHTLITTFFVLFLENGVSASLIQRSNALIPRDVLTFPSECQIECQTLVNAVNCGADNQCACSFDIEDAIEACQTCVQEQIAHEEQMAAINSIGDDGSDSGTTTNDPQTTITLPNVAQYQEVCSSLASAGSTSSTNTNVDSTSNGGGNTGGSGLGAQSSNAVLKVNPRAFLLRWLITIGSGYVFLNT